LQQYKVQFLGVLFRLITLLSAHFRRPLFMLLAIFKHSKIPSCCKHFGHYVKIFNHINFYLEYIPEQVNWTAVVALTKVDVKHGGISAFNNDCLAGTGSDNVVKVCDSVLHQRTKTITNLLYGVRQRQTIYMASQKTYLPDTDPRKARMLHFLRATPFKPKYGHSQFSFFSRVTLYTSLAGNQKHVAAVHTIRRSPEK